MEIQCSSGPGVTAGPSKCTQSCIPGASNTELQLAIGHPSPGPGHLTSRLFRRACSCTDCTSVTGSIGSPRWPVLRPSQSRLTALLAAARLHACAQGLVLSWVLANKMLRSPGFRSLANGVCVGEGASIQAEKVNFFREARGACRSAGAFVTVGRTRTRKGSSDIRRDIRSTSGTHGFRPSSACQSTVLRHARWPASRFLQKGGTATPMGDS